VATETPKVFVFCNSCAPGWHHMMAVAEDGTTLAAHICSHHGFAAMDMGIHPNGWKRDKYAAHYPDGFTVEWVEDALPGKHVGLDEALRRHLVRMEKDATQAPPEPSP
jgi:hypothetical protein